MMSSEYEKFLEFNVEDNPLRHMINESHGFEIFKALASEALFDLGMLDKQNFMRIITNEFIDFLQREQSNNYFNGKLISQQDFKLFLAFIYCQPTYIFSDFLVALVDPRFVQSFLEETPNLKSNIKMPNESHSSQVHPFLFPPPPPPPPPATGTDSPNNNIKESINTSANNSTTPSGSMVTYNSEIGMQKEIHKQILLKQNIEPNIDANNQPIQQKHVHAQIQQKNQSIETGDEKFFNEQYKKCMSQANAISELHLLIDRRKDITFEIDYEYGNGQFICIYFSKELGITNIRSDPKNTKKEAQHNAARKFLAHINYWINKGCPFILNEDDLFEYNEMLLQRKNRNEILNNQQLQSPHDSLSPNIAETGEEEYDIFADQELLLNYNQEIVIVTQILQQQCGNHAVSCIQIKSDNRIHGFFQCLLTFSHNGFRHSTEGRGQNKQFAKEIAYIKLYPHIVEYFFPSESKKEPETEIQYARYQENDRKDNNSTRRNRGNRGNQQPPAQHEFDQDDY